MKILPPYASAWGLALMGCGTTRTVPLGRPTA
jgi:hypothetical protein